MKPLTPFGALVSKHLKERSVARKQLATVAGISSAAVTRILHAKKGDSKAFAVHPSYLIPWADALCLTGPDRRTFFAMGLLDRCTPTDAKVLWRGLGLDGEWPEQ